MFLKISFYSNRCLNIKTFVFKFRGLIECKKIDIVEAFAKYGAIDQIHIMTNPIGTSAEVAFKSEKAALSALGGDKIVKILDCAVSIRKKHETESDLKGSIADRTIYVTNIKEGTNAEQLCKHFESCGDIEFFKLKPKNLDTQCLNASIVFKTKAGVSEALKLHNSVLNESNINVYTKARQTKINFDEKLTILLRNKQGLNFIDPEKIESIFSECGEIVNVKICVKKNTLAFVTFKTEQAAAKALEMSGETKGLELEIERYSPAKNLAIRVINLDIAVTEADLRKHFEEVGKIKSIFLKKYEAIIKFEDSDGFCKSFLLNESYLYNRIMYIEPVRTLRTSKTFHRNTNTKRGYKRPYEDGHTAFKAKKFKQQ